VLLRYRNVVDYWESWLEPNHKSFWPSGPNPQQYANLLRAEYQVFQSVNRQYGLHLKLLFGGPSDFSIIPGSPGGMARAGSTPSPCTPTGFHRRPPARR
jgi:hypothetical protein